MTQTNWERLLKRWGQTGSANLLRTFGDHGKEKGGSEGCNSDLQNGHGKQLLQITAWQDGYQSWVRVSNVP